MRSKSDRGRADRRVFPPSEIASVKAVACELPAQLELPFSRFSIEEIRRVVIERGVVEAISATTLWEWLHDDGLRPWTHRPWIFPRDPDFMGKGSLVLDLYHRLWDGKPLGEKDFVISADEKTSIQARRRKHPSTPPGADRPGRFEHEYERKGALAYLAAYDVHRANVFGRCDDTTGIIPFGKLVDHVMEQEPYRSATRVFWIVDNGSSHRGQAACERLRKKWSNLILVHTPVHASWLNQVEIYFSILQRKVLTPNDFKSLQDLERTILAFQDRFSKLGQPFKWKFTRDDLRRYLVKLPDLPLAA
ncbi:MAG TPA: IS630 family transposase [Thermoanaerobaculia bacterium]|nr:IS630 family transposase [Thermoanaerobaculia bacterium]